MTFETIFILAGLWYAIGLVGSFLGVVWLHDRHRWSDWVPGDYWIALLGPCNLFGVLLAMATVP